MAPLSFFNFHHRLHLHRVGEQHLLSQVVLAASSSPTAWSAGRGPSASLSLTPKWYLPRSVALRVVGGHQKVRYTTAGEPATDLTGVLPDHRCVMTDAWPGTLSGVICHLFFLTHSLGLSTGAILPSSSARSAGQVIPTV